MISNESALIVTFFKDKITNHIFWNKFIFFSRQPDRQIEILNNKAMHNLINEKCRWRSDWLDGAGSFWEPLGQTHVMQIRKGETPNHQRAITHDFCCLSCQLCFVKKIFNIHWQGECCALDILIYNIRFVEYRCGGVTLVTRKVERSINIFIDKTLLWAHAGL